MKRTIAPKPTWYRHTRFRSQLEAKWAIFFDQLQIMWFYEPRSYSLTGGTRYVPDFWLPRFNRWGSKGDFYVEVKPHGFSSNKGIEFARQYHAQLLIAAGEPACGPHDHYRWCNEDDEFLLSDSCFDSKYLPGGSHQDEYRMFEFSGGIDIAKHAHSVRHAAFVVSTHFPRLPLAVHR